MNRLPNPTRQDLAITMSALLYLINNHKLMAEDRDAARRVVAIVALRYFDIPTHDQDLHP